MLKAGQVVALDTTPNLLGRFSSHTLRLRTVSDKPAQLGMTQERITQEENMQEIPSGWWACAFAHFDEIEPMLASIRNAGCVIDDLEIGKPDLEDVFVRVMQEQDHIKLASHE